MELFVGIVIGILLCVSIYGAYIKFHPKQKPSGAFVIDFSDPLKDICRIELEENVYDICDKKQIVLTIKHIAE